MDVTVVVLTFNEEKNLAACLESVQRLGADVLVVDSGSTDRTIEIARRFGAAPVSHPFETHARQWQWALESLPIRTTWVLGLDADQRVTPELASAIERFVASPTTANGAYVCRRQVFRGKWIRFGGYYPKYLLKLFRRDSVIVNPGELVDHHFAVSGSTVILKGDLIEANLNEDDIQIWIAKHNRYAVMQAREEIRLRDARDDAGRSGRGTPDDKTQRAKRAWRRMPLFIRPFLYFGYRYFLRLGILDGKQGFIFHFLQAFWYRLLVDINIDEMRSGPSAPAPSNARAQENR